MVALLLPAVQAAREAARRTQCINNMKQLALACHTYHDGNGCFPPAYTRGRRAGSNNHEKFGWHVYLLPYLEEKGLYDVLNPTIFELEDVCAKRNPRVPNPVATLRSRVGSFYCPSDSQRRGGEEHIADQQRHFGGGLGTVAGGLGNWRPGKTNYIGNRGTRDQVQTSNDPQGVLFYDSAIRMDSDIFDGQTNTFMIGERDSLKCRAGTWPGIRNPNGGGSRGIWTNIGHSRTVLNAPSPPFGWGSNNGCGESFASLHPEGANFALCDASVRFIKDTIEFIDGGQVVGGSMRQVWAVFTPGDRRWAWYYTYNKLSRRNDGFPIGANEF
ncbi:MAG: DUF1559 domain-containing protein [Planctomycetota bacterium]